MKNICFLTYRCRWVRYRFGPSPLWSRIGCTVSEPDPNSAAACGVSGAQTFPAGLKRRVSTPAVLTCSSAQWAYLCLCLDFLNESTSASVYRQWSIYSISVALYLCKLSDNAEMFSFIWVFYAVISSPLTACGIRISHWNRPYWVVKPLISGETQDAQQLNTEIIIKCH